MVMNLQEFIQVYIEQLHLWWNLWASNPDALWGKYVSIPVIAITLSIAISSLRTEGKEKAE